MDNDKEEFKKLRESYKKEWEGKDFDEEWKKEWEDILEKVTTYFESDEYDKVINILTELIKKDNEHPFGNIYLGMAFNKKDDHKKAIEKLTKGISLAERFKNYDGFDPTDPTEESIKSLFHTKKRNGKLVLPTSKKLEERDLALQKKKRLIHHQLYRKPIFFVLILILKLEITKMQL